MESQPKSYGISYLRHAVAHRNKKLNYISLPVEKAQEIINESGGYQPSQASLYTSRSNSVRGAAVVLAMDVKELCERLNGKSTAQLLNDLAEAKNKIKVLYDAGDRLAQLAGDKDFNAMKNWVHAKKL